MSWQGLIDQSVLPIEFQNASSPPVPPSVVETWKCWSSLAEAASTKSLLAGHPVVASACWYLDYTSDVDEYLKDNPVVAAVSAAFRATATHAPTSHPTGRSQDRSRILRITKPPPTTPHFEGVEGGEAAMWTEKVDFTNFECRVWPRALLMASSLWGLNNAFTPPPLLNQMGENITDQHQLLLTQREEAYRGLSLLLSYVRLRFFFQNKLKISGSEITIHRRAPAKPSSSKSTSFEYVPLPIHSERDLFLALRASSSISLSADGRKFQSGDLKLRSQCPMISQSIQRPVGMKEKRIAQINLENGAASASRDALLSKWLFQKANEGVLFIGLCELNGWQQLESATDLSKNFPLIHSKAARAGFVYAHLLQAAQHPFHLGIISAIPFEVRAELGPPQFQRGVLHVFFPSLRLHAFVCHLHAHNATAREIETRSLLEIHLLPLLDQQERVVVMGDMNSLYEGDRAVHNEEDLASLFRRRDHPVFQRLQKKFSSPSGTEIDYRPLHNLVASGQLVETCIAHCHHQTRGSDSVLSLLSSKWLSWMLGETFLSPAECVSRYCSATEPTHHNPEVRPSLLFFSKKLLVARHPRARDDAEDETRLYLRFPGAARGSLALLARDRYESQEKAVRG
jgi:hypothetical protein